jgi:hypothetical protein
MIATKKERQEIVEIIERAAKHGLDDEKVKEFLKIHKDRIKELS